MRIILGILLVATAFTANAQRDLTPSKKGQAFGTRDFRTLRNYGLQAQLGPIWTFPSKKMDVFDFNNGASRGTYQIDPDGRWGVYGELGLAHFPKKRSGLSLALKTVLVSYYDWGIGFKYYGGKETTIINTTDALGNVISTEEEQGKFYNGLLYGRFSLHKNIMLGEKKNFFLDNSLGVNLDYNILSADPQSPYHTNYSAIYSPGAQNQGNFMAQLHYGLGFGFRLRRGTYLIPGVRTPILGIYEWNKGTPAFHWYSSKYWPVLFHIKIINLFEKKNKGGCPPVDVNDEDRKKNEEFMQGN